MRLFLLHSVFENRVVLRKGNSMTREQFALKIRWQFIVWLAGIINAFAFLPQVWDVIQTHSVESISLATLVIVFWIQVAFALEGFFKRNFVLLISNGCAAGMNAILTSLVIYYRFFAGK